MRKHKRRNNFARQPSQVFVVPAPAVNVKERARASRRSSGGKEDSPGGRDRGEHAGRWVCRLGHHTVRVPACAARQLCKQAAAESAVQLRSSLACMRTNAEAVAVQRAQREVPVHCRVLPALFCVVALLYDAPRWP